MDIHKDNYFLNQAIQKVQEACEALKILEIHDPTAGIGAYSNAADHTKEALEMLYKTKEERERAIHNAKIREIQEKRLCKELNIPYLVRD